MKKQTKIVLIAAAIIIVVGAIFLALYLLRVKSYQNSVANITYRHQNAANVPNGVYIGECDVDFIYAKVEVEVENGFITQINLLEHRNERGTPAEGIEQKIIEQQEIDVDAISGATNSSSVIKKAVDNALSQAA